MKSELCQLQYHHQTNAILLVTEIVQIMMIVTKTATVTMTAIVTETMRVRAVQR